MRALVVGYGSIGARHAAVLEELGAHVAVVSRRDVVGRPAYADLGEGLRNFDPEYVVVSNETVLHESTLNRLAQEDYSGIVLVEKPLFSAAGQLPRHRFAHCAVAYNLRFHPVLTRLKTLLETEHIVTANVYVGQYLPDWRPGTDYRKCYSASVERGGGVLRDLSHELDYMCWLLGGWSSVAAVGGHLSALEINSDDAFSLLMDTPKCAAASVHLNYLERIPKRLITINTERHTLQADLIKGSLSIDSTLESIEVERNVTYYAMHAEMMSGGAKVACSLEEGVDTMLLIDAAYKAAQTRKWIEK
jgi:predicted dehydrogenase